METDHFDSGTIFLLVIMFSILKKEKEKIFLNMFYFVFKWKTWEASVAPLHAFFSQKCLIII